jgi:hypothetical protein
MGFQFTPRKVLIQFDETYGVEGLEIWASRDTTMDQVDELQALQAEAEGKNDQEKTRAFLDFAAEHVFLNWNVEDKAGKPVKITSKALAQVPLDVLNEAIRQYAAFMKEGKTNLQNGSTPSSGEKAASPQN